MSFDRVSSRFQAVALLTGLLVSPGAWDASTRVPLHLADLESVRFGVSLHQHGADALDQQNLKSMLKDRGTRILESAGLHTTSSDEVFLTFSVRVHGTKGEGASCYAAHLALRLTEPVVVSRGGSSAVPGGAQTYVADQVVLSSNLGDLEEDISTYLDILLNEFIKERQVARDYWEQEAAERQ